MKGNVMRNIVAALHRSTAVRPAGVPPANPFSIYLTGETPVGHTAGTAVLP